MERYGQVIQLNSQKMEEYLRLHREVWDDVLAMISKCHIRNYTIFIHQLPDGNHYLFAYWEYDGEDFDADMAQMAADPTTQKWWDVCKPCQIPLPNRKEGEWWATMEEAFHLD